MTDYSAIKSFFHSEKLSFFTFFPKSVKLIKAVIRYIPSNTPAEEIYEALLEHGFRVIIVKQITSNRKPSTEGNQKAANLPLFHITLSRSQNRPLSQLCQSGSTQDPEWSDTVPLLPAVQLCLGQLQPALTLHVVQRRPLAQKLPGEREHHFHSGLLQLQTG
jgi:hypothetical protein